MSIIPKPQPGQRVHLRNLPGGGFTAEIWQGEIQVADSQYVLGDGLLVSDENTDLAAIRLLESLRAIGDYESVIMITPR